MTQPNATHCSACAGSVPYQPRQLTHRLASTSNRCQGTQCPQRHHQGDLLHSSRRSRCTVLQAIAQPETATIEEALPADPTAVHPSNKAPTQFEYDAVIIGSGIGGLTTATQMAAKGAKVVVLEKYVIPGGSAGHYHREGYTFDVGSSMMFGMGQEGTTNLITRALSAVGKSLDTVPDPTQIHYHLPPSKAHPQSTFPQPETDFHSVRRQSGDQHCIIWGIRESESLHASQGLDVKVWRKYDDFVEELSERFPHEREGIKKFYGECWAVFNSLNSLELKSLEEPRYLLGEFAKHPIACLTLASYLPSNTGDVARKYIKDPELLSFIDIECYCWSTVLAEHTPMINAGMVFCDRHYGGINYPRGGVGRIGELLVEGLQERGSYIEFKANVKDIILAGKGDQQKAVGVRLADGRVFRGKAVISNATRWDTFEKLMAQEEMPKSEALFRKRYKKSPSFLSIHMGVRADVLPRGTQCHHIIVEDWNTMESPLGTLFVSIPTLLDPSLSPDGTHIVHVFSPDWIDNWKTLSAPDYERKKEETADALVKRVEAFLPGLTEATVFREVGTPRTHRRFLSRDDGSYGPIPSRRPLGMLGMPFNRTSVQGLYCVGDSTFPGQGVNAVVFSGFGCAHRVLCDQGKQPVIPVLDQGYNGLLAAVRDRS